MDVILRERARRAGLALLVLLPLTPAVAQEVVRQTLDTVQVFGGATVLERFLDPDNTAAGVSYEPTGLGGTTLTACQLTAARGLFCLDGDTVVRWPDTEDPGSRTPLFKCSEVPGLVACTGLTVESSGTTLWLAGRNRGKTHNLVKVAADTSGTCPVAGGWQRIPSALVGSAGQFQACTWTSGRPLLVDISSVDSSAANLLNPGGCTASPCAQGQGILGLEERRRVVFFPTVVASGATSIPQPVEVAAGKTGWGLAGNEQLLGAALFQSEGASYVLATTTQHRLLRATTDGTSLVDAVRGTNNLPLSLRGSCGSRATPQYGIRTSAKSGLVYVTDRACPRITAYEPQGLSLAPVAAESVALSIAPEGPTIAAGIGLSLADFTGAPRTALGGEGGPALEIGFVKLADEERTGVTLFQVKGIPDCRWLQVNGNAPAICTPETIYPGTGSGPAGQFLNVTPLLPAEITDLFDESGAPPAGLPPLLIHPEYRGQAKNGFYFEALFAVTEDGVIFQDTFELVLSVAELTGGTEFECRPKIPGSLPAGTPVADLLEWDVATKVSENFISKDKASLDRHSDTLINVGCGSTRSVGTRFSLIPYNLEITPDTYVGVRLVEANDAVFGRLLLKLFGELGDATRDLACDVVPSDNPGATLAPLSGATCSTLLANWANAADKLQKCFDATSQPKASAGDQNCQSFLTQFASFRNTLRAAWPNGPDAANRRGELEARTQVIEHVYRDRFVPSIPRGGFCREAQELGTGSCPGP